MPKKLSLVLGVGLTSLGLWVTTLGVPIALLAPPQSPGPRPGDTYQPYTGPHASTPRSDCTVDIDTSANRNVILNESFTLKAHVHWDGPCDLSMKVYAPAFDVKPESTEFTIWDIDEAKKGRDVYFSFLPKQPGPQVIVVEYNRNQKRLEYSTFSHKYIPPGLAAWFGPLTTLGGSILTLPWWFDFFERRRKRKEEEEKARQEKKSRLIVEP